MTPIERLAQWLRSHHPNYTTDDVAITDTKGYLQCTKPCPRCDHWYCAHTEPFYHTIGIAGVGYPNRNERGQFESPYRLWRELHGVLPAAK